MEDWTKVFTRSVVNKVRLLPVGQETRKEEPSYIMCVDEKGGEHLQSSHTALNAAEASPTHWKGWGKSHSQ